MTVQHCRAKNPTTCKYHGAELRADQARTRGDFAAYLTATHEMEENRGIGRAEEAAFLPTPDTATSTDLMYDHHHLIIDYPTESTYDMTWTEEGAPIPDLSDPDGNPHPTGYEENTYTRFVLTGNLANRILRKLGKTTGRVTLTEATIPYRISDYTGDTDYEFTVEVDGREVWHATPANQYVTIDTTNRRPHDSISLSHIGNLNAWLNA